MLPMVYLGPLLSFSFYINYVYTCFYMHVCMYG